MYTWNLDDVYQLALKIEEVHVLRLSRCPTFQPGGSRDQPTSKIAQGAGSNNSYHSSMKVITASILQILILEVLTRKTLLSL